MNIDDIPALTREDLDRSMCGIPGCDHTSHDGLYLHAVCHERAPLECFYRNGAMVIRCGRCGGFVAKIAIASASSTAVLLH